MPPAKKKVVASKAKALKASGASSRTAYGKQKTSPRATKGTKPYIYIISLFYFTLFLPLALFALSNPRINCCLFGKVFCDVSMLSLY